MTAKKKTVTVIAVICAVLVSSILLVATAGAAMIAFVGWVWGGVRFTPRLLWNA